MTQFKVGDRVHRTQFKDDVLFEIKRIYDDGSVTIRVLKAAPGFTLRAGHSVATYLNKLRFADDDTQQAQPVSFQPGDIIEITHEAGFDWGQRVVITNEEFKAATGYVVGKDCVAHKPAGAGYRPPKEAWYLYAAFTNLATVKASPVVKSDVPSRSDRFQPGEIVETCNTLLYGNVVHRFTVTSDDGKNVQGTNCDQKDCGFDGMHGGNRRNFRRPQPAKFGSGTTSAGSAELPRFKVGDYVTVKRGADRLMGGLSGYVVKNFTGIGDAAVFVDVQIRSDLVARFKQDDVEPFSGKARVGTKLGGMIVSDVKIMDEVSASNQPIHYDFSLRDALKKLLPGVKESFIDAYKGSWPTPTSVGRLDWSPLQEKQAEDRVHRTAPSRYLACLMRDYNVDAPAKLVQSRKGSDHNRYDWCLCCKTEVAVTTRKGLVDWPHRKGCDVAAAIGARTLKC